MHHNLTYQSLWLRIGCLGICIIFFWTNVLFAQAANPSFWQERQQKIRNQSSEFSKQNNGKNSVLLARLPALLPSSQPSPLRRRGLNGTGTSPVILSSIAPYADIKEVYSPKPNPKSSKSPQVIIIQDIHRNHEAQQNIANIIQSVVAQFTGGEALSSFRIERRSISRSSTAPNKSGNYTTTTPDKSGNYNERNNASVVIGLEGAWGPFNLAPYTAFPDKEITADIADYFLEKGFLSGAEYAGLISPIDNIKLIGIEDKNLYQNHVQTFKKSVLLERQVKVEIEKLQGQLRQQKKKVFGPELLELDSKILAYHKSELRLGEFLTYLTKLSKENNYKNINLFLEALQLEKTIDFTKAEKERNEIIELLTTELPENYLDKLVQAGVSYRQGEISSSQFYSLVTNLINTGIIRNETTKKYSYSEFFRYSHYVVLSDQIVPEKLFSETSNLEDNVLRISAQKAPASNRILKLCEAGKHLALTKKLIDHSLTPEEWEQYKQAQSNGIEELKSNLSSFEQFYGIALQRNNALVSNLLTSTLSSTYVLIAGGFHTPGITRILREKRIPHVVLTPRLSKVEGKGTDYLGEFQRDKSPLEKLFTGERLTLNPTPQLHPESPYHDVFNRVFSELVFSAHLAEELRKLPGNSHRKNKALQQIYKRLYGEFRKQLNQILQSGGNFENIEAGKIEVNDAGLWIPYTLTWREKGKVKHARNTFLITTEEQTDTIVYKATLKQLAPANKFFLVSEGNLKRTNLNFKIFSIHSVWHVRLYANLTRFLKNITGKPKLFRIKIQRPWQWVTLPLPIPVTPDGAIFGEFPQLSLPIPRIPIQFMAKDTADETTRQTQDNISDTDQTGDINSIKPLVQAEFADLLNILKDIDPDEPDPNAVNNMEKRLDIFNSKRATITANPTGYHFVTLAKYQWLLFQDLKPGNTYRLQARWEEYGDLIVYFIGIDEVVGYSLTEYLRKLRNTKQKKISAPVKARAKTIDEARNDARPWLQTLAKAALSTSLIAVNAPVLKNMEQYLETFRNGKLTATASPAGNYTITTGNRSYSINGLIPNQTYVVEPYLEPWRILRIYFISKDNVVGYSLNDDLRKKHEKTTKLLQVPLTVRAKPLDEARKDAREWLNTLLGIGLTINKLNPDPQDLAVLEIELAAFRDQNMTASIHSTGSYFIKTIDKDLIFQGLLPDETYVVKPYWEPYVGLHVYFVGKGNVLDYSLSDYLLDWQSIPQERIFIPLKNRTKTLEDARNNPKEWLKLLMRTSMTINPDNPEPTALAELEKQLGVFNNRGFTDSSNASGDYFVPFTKNQWFQFGGLTPGKTYKLYGYWESWQDLRIYFVADDKAIGYSITDYLRNRDKKQQKASSNKIPMKSHGKTLQEARHDFSMWLSMLTQFSTTVDLLNPNQEILDILEQKLVALRNQQLSIIASPTGSRVAEPMENYKMAFSHLEGGKTYLLQPYWEPWQELIIYFVGENDVVGYSFTQFLREKQPLARINVPIKVRAKTFAEAREDASEWLTRLVKIAALAGDPINPNQEALDELERQLNQLITGGLNFRITTNQNGVYEIAYAKYHLIKFHGLEPDETYTILPYWEPELGLLVYFVSKNEVLLYSVRPYIRNDLAYKQQHIITGHIIVCAPNIAITQEWLSDVKQHLIFKMPRPVLLGGRFAEPEALMAPDDTPEEAAKNELKNKFWKILGEHGYTTLQIERFISLGELVVSGLTIEEALQEENIPEGERAWYLRQWGEILPDLLRPIHTGEKLLQKKDNISDVDQTDVINPFPFSLERYEALEKFLHKHRLASQGLSNGTVYSPTPYEALPAIFSELQKVIGNINGKHLLDLGTGGDLRTSLAATYLYNMKATSVEKDRYISTRAKTVFDEAKKAGFAENINFYGETDGLDVTWSNTDVILFYYTEPASSLEETAEFRAKLQNKMKETHPGTILAILYTEAQAASKPDILFPELEPLFKPGPQPLSAYQGNLYLQLYRLPSHDTGTTDTLPPIQRVLQELEKHAVKQGYNPDEIMAQVRFYQTFTNDLDVDIPFNELKGTEAMERLAKIGLFLNEADREGAILTLLDQAMDEAGEERKKGVLPILDTANMELTDIKQLLDYQIKRILGERDLEQSKVIAVVAADKYQANNTQKEFDGLPHGNLELRIITQDEVLNSGYLILDTAIEKLKLNKLILAQNHPVAIITTRYNQWNYKDFQDRYKDMAAVMVLELIGNISTRKSEEPQTAIETTWIILKQA